MSKFYLICLLTLVTSSFAIEKEQVKIPEINEKFHGYWSALKDKGDHKSGVKVQKKQFQYYSMVEEIHYSEANKIIGGTSQQILSTKGSSRSLDNLQLLGDTLIIHHQGFHIGAKPQTYKFLKSETTPKSPFILIESKDWPKKLSNEEATLIRKGSGFLFNRSKGGMSLTLATKKSDSIQKQNLYLENVKRMRLSLFGL
jgi:hypothetical protein